MDGFIVRRWNGLPFLLVLAVSVAAILSGVRLKAQSVAGSPAQPITGELKVSSNPHYFQDTHGAAIILNGSQTWNTFQDWGAERSVQALDFDAFVKFLAAHGHNFTLLWISEVANEGSRPGAAPSGFTISPLPWQRTGPGMATDGGLKFDITKFDPNFFGRLRTRVQALNNAGVYAGVYLFTGEFLNIFRCANDGYPLTGANNINGIDDGYVSGLQGINALTMTAPNAITKVQDAYVEKVIDTLNDLPNVLWVVSEEAPRNSLWWNNHQIAHIRAYESGKPHHHPIGYAAPISTWDSKIYDSDADWVAPSTIVSPASSCGAGKPACKVNVNDSDHSYFGIWNDTPQQNRNYAWENFTTGNQVLFMDPYVVHLPRENRNLCASPTHSICRAPDPRYDNFRDNLGYVLRYSRKLNLSLVAPRDRVSSTGFCLAQTPSVGAEYLVYAPAGGSFTVDLSAMSSTRTLAVEWFNPATGTATPGESVPAGSSAHEFTPPFSGDAVLYLVDSAGHSTAETH